MTLFTVTTKQLILNSILLAIFVAILVVTYFEVKDFRGLPVVTLDSEGKCVQVMNYNNGDAYNCNDVDVLLRKYRVKK